MIILAALPCGASAEPPESVSVEFNFSGFGNMELVSPPLYSGNVDAGDPLVLGGDWWIRVDDTGWPSTADPEARWNSIFSHYFTHDPGTFSWTGVFDEHTCATRPVWGINTPTNGTMGGTLALVVTFTDWNMNGILDLDERMMGVYSGTLIVMKYGTGVFAGYCGLGAYNGGFTNGDPGNWADDYVEGHCILDLKNCAIGVQQASWSAVKKIYQ